MTTVTVTVKNRAPDGPPSILLGDQAERRGREVDRDVRDRRQRVPARGRDRDVVPRERTRSDAVRVERARGARGELAAAHRAGRARQRSRSLIDFRRAGAWSPWHEAHVSATDRSGPLLPPRPPLQCIEVRTWPRQPSNGDAAGQLSRRREVPRFGPRPSKQIDCEGVTDEFGDRLVRSHGPNGQSFPGVEEIDRRGVAWPSALNLRRASIRSFVAPG